MRGKQRPREASITVVQQSTRHQASHLTADDFEAIGRELDALRQRVIESRGERDAAYIRRVIAVQRALELSSRAVLLAGKWRPAWVLGTASLSVAKILDNMEIGHNILHGQWDWMRDPKIHSSTWDWDHSSPPEQWKRAHNDTHHKYTNIIGKDNDLGYGIMRVAEEQEWHPRFLAQPVWNFITACIFEWGITMYDADLGASLRERRRPSPRRPAGGSARRCARPPSRRPEGLPAPPGAVRAAASSRTLAANATANLARNLWSHSVIMCGHFPEERRDLRARRASPTNETRGEWYLRQMLGSADVSGPHAHAPDDRATSPTRSSTTSSPTSRATGTPRSRSTSSACSSATG